LSLLRGPRFAGGQIGGRVLGDCALLSFVGALVAAVAVAGCPKSECSCTSPVSITIVAAPGAIADVKLRGDGCADSLPSCPESTSEDYPPGCARTLVFARHGGACDVEIDLASGAVVTRTVQLVENDDGCCNPVTAANAADGEIDLTAGDAGQDTGQDGG
jgi:hypothetical protein